MDVARGMVNLLDIVERTITECQQQPPAVLLISPPGGEKLTPEMAAHCRGDLAKFAELPAAYQRLAQDRVCSFLDAAQSVEPAEVSDGIHMNEPGNRKLAKQVAGCQLPRYIPHPFTRVITPVGDQHHLVSVDFGRLCLGKVFPGTLLLSDCNRSLYPASASRVAALGFD